MEKKLYPMGIMGLGMITMNRTHLPMYPNKIISLWLFCYLLHARMTISKYIIPWCNAIVINLT
jgi:hypothetical protein